MNKTELVAAIADKTELSKKDSEKALKAFIDVVGEELKKGEKIQISFAIIETAFQAWILPFWHRNLPRNRHSFQSYRQYPVLLFPRTAG